MHAAAARIWANGGTVLLEELEATLDKASLGKLAGQVRQTVPRDRGRAAGDC